MEVLYGITVHDGIAIGKTVIHNPLNGINEYSNCDYDIIILSNNLTPTETIRFGEKKVKALVVTEATPTSHTAILSRTMNWPALSGIAINTYWDDKIAIVDGYEQKLIIDPDPEVLEHYFRKKENDQIRINNLLMTYKGRSAETKSGKRIQLLANISTVSDIEKVIKYDAEGIGNFKTEFMYLGSVDYPTEEDLFQAYKIIVEQMQDKKVVIRTFDIGTDKVADYFELEKEENPALGYRAIRIGLDRPEIFKTQLRAILRVSALGNVAIMYPMIVSVEEIIVIKRMLSEVMNEMSVEGIPFDKKIQQGIMIETPAAVIMSYELAQEVDFFSIGTNDLIQYTLAADRQNPKLANVYNPYHPAIMRSIKFVVENAHKSNVWVEISGELGGDITQIGKFIEIGLDAIAVSPVKIPTLRKAISELE